jgi:membrane-bound inhibitor of C-type lysozyme
LHDPRFGLKLPSPLTGGFGMRIESIVLTLALGALVACSRSDDSDTAAQSGDAESAEAGTAGEAGGTQVASAPYVGHDYTCSDGVTFNARLDKGNTLVTLEGKTLTLTPVKGAFDAQYEGEGVMFTARGDQATLVRAEGLSVTCKVN